MQLASTQWQHCLLKIWEGTACVEFAGWGDFAGFAEYSWCVGRAKPIFQDEHLKFAVLYWFRRFYLIPHLAGMISMRSLPTLIPMMVAILVCAPQIGHAQVSRFFKPHPAGARQAYNPHTQAAPTQRQRRPVRQAGVQQVQLEELIPDPIVPSAMNEAAIPGMEATPTRPFVGETVLTPPPSQSVHASEYVGAPATEEYPSMQGDPIYQGATSGMGEMVIDQGYGQPYDMALNDVIPHAAETYSTGDWFRNGNWYSKQEFVMLLRADLPLQHLALDRSFGASSSPNVVPSLSTKEADFTFETGTRLSIGHRLGRDPANRDHALEFVFFGLFDYTGQAALSPAIPEQGTGLRTLLATEEARLAVAGGATGGFLSINDVNGLDNSGLVEIEHTANFNSFELNYVLGARPAKDRLVMQPDGRWVRHATPSKVRGLFAGLRYVRQNDSFRYRGIGEVSANGTDLDVGGTYQVRTDNDLIGVQIGSEFVQKRTDWVFGLKGKVGGLVNFADRVNRLSQTTVSSDQTTRTLTTNVTREELNDETLTFLGEAGIYVAYYVRPNTALRFGYDALYMNGMATATGNAGIRGSDDDIQFAKFEMTGDSLYHGMNFGLEMTW